MATVTVFRSTRDNGNNTCHGDDCWIGVTDPKKRKQIQDRLAQRARRKQNCSRKILMILVYNEAGKRLALANEKNTSSSSKLVRSKETIKPGKTGTHPAFIAGVTNSNDSEAILLMPIPLNVYSALYKNGTYLNLLCSHCIPALSTPAGPDVPEPLRPTSVQIMTIHPPWIDRFPFPKMRENFIMLLGVVDPEDFLNDMFNGPSFTLQAGGASWDPRVWVIEESFRRKWGFLFDNNLFGA